MTGKAGLRAITPLDRDVAPPGWRSEAGKAPYLAFVAISKLRVETGYQREIGVAGRRNIARIVAGFRWSRFAPLIVAPLDGGLFAVIDGQHRATALATLGEVQAPCIVYDSDYEARADAYAAINTAVTAMSPQAKFHALVAQRDEAACAAAAACAKSGVRILKFSVAQEKLRKWETVSTAALLRAARECPKDMLKTEMQKGLPT